MVKAGTILILTESFGYGSSNWSCPYKVVRDFDWRHVVRVCRELVNDPEVFIDDVILYLRRNGMIELVRHVNWCVHDIKGDVHEPEVYGA